MKIQVMAGVCLLVLVGGLQGGTYTIDDDGEADFSRIQEAINRSWDGDTLVVMPGDYGDPFYFNNRRITLTSMDPDDPNVVASTVISGEILFDFFEDGESVVQGMTIRGGIRCIGASPRIVGNVFENYIAQRVIIGTYGAAPVIEQNRFAHNLAGAILGCDGLIEGNQFIENGSESVISGGGVRQCNGTIRFNEFYGNQAGRGGALGECQGEIRENQIIGNQAQQYGGGVYDCDGLIQDNVIEGNQCSGSAMTLYGGGLSSCDGTISGNVIRGNQLVADSGHQARGGGLYQCHAEIRGNVIEGNRVEGLLALGGGICQSMAGRIEGNIIRGNRAESSGQNARGGGLYLCDVEVIHNIIEGNLVLGGRAATEAAGGGVYLGKTVVNNTIVGNRVINREDETLTLGGGIYQVEQLRNNIIAYNQASNGGGLYGEGVANRYNLFWGNGFKNFGGQSYGQIGDRYAPVRFVMAGTWDDNGSPDDPGDDLWVSGDYHLQSTAGHWEESGWVSDGQSSLGVDGGDPNDVTGQELNPNGGRINLGAYGGTAQASLSENGDGDGPDPVCTAAIPADINGDCRVDLLDYQLLVESWMMCHLAPVAACGG